MRAVLSFLLALGVFDEACGAPSWTPLSPLPDPIGVAAPFAGVSDGVLLVAGGANFPGRPPWEGGKKVWHDTVWALRSMTGTWQEVGTLTRPRAYGVSLTHRNRLLCVGGSDATGHTSDVTGIRWRRGRIESVPLADLPPPLPMPMANGAGVVDGGGTAYIACGNSEPGELVASGRVFSIRLGSREVAWTELPPIPAEPRILPVAAGLTKGFCLMGGAALEIKGGRPVRRYLRDVWRYRPSRGWDRLPDLPEPCVAAASPAPVHRDALYVVGGDDGSRFGQPADRGHPGFSNTLHRLDLRTLQWTDIGRLPAPRVTLPCVPWKGGWILPSGEVRPGVRSPEVWRLRLP